LTKPNEKKKILGSFLPSLSQNPQSEIAENFRAWDFEGYNLTLYPKFYLSSLENLEDKLWGVKMFWHFTTTKGVHVHQIISLDFLNEFTGYSEWGLVKK
jgi:hypothetical protein